MTNQDRPRRAPRRAGAVLCLSLMGVMIASAPLAAQVVPVAPAPNLALAATLTPGTARSSEARAGYRPPVPDAVVRATFNPPATRWASGHRGVDLEGAVGAQVLAPGPGVVRFASTVVDRGVVTVEHPDGRRSSLEPVLAQVEVGMLVAAGQVLGTLQDAASHCPDVQCLHWGVRWGTTYLDPLSLLVGSGPVVLLPVTTS